MEYKWYNLTPNDTLKALQSSREGLSTEEAQERLKRYGPNQLRQKRKTHPFITFLHQFFSPLIYILLTAAIVSILTKHYIDAIVIFCILLANAIIGYIQETRAERAMEALMQMATPRAKVKRGGNILQISTSSIVPRDIVLLESGDKVPADARLLESSKLKVDEAILTGESMPVDKHSIALEDELVVADRKNMLHMNTIVNYGRATAVVVNTGMTTEIGKIAGALEEIRSEKTPLQKGIETLSRYIIFTVLAVLVLLIVPGILRGLNWLELFYLAISVVYLPFMQIAFSTVPLGIDKWCIAIASGALLFSIEELRKLAFPRLFSLGKWQPVRNI
jgi:Ca2+-transporting ATPase